MLRQSCRCALRAASQLGSSSLKVTAAALSSQELVDSGSSGRQHSTLADQEQEDAAAYPPRTPEFPYYTYRVSRTFKRRQKRERFQFKHHGTTCNRVWLDQSTAGQNLPVPRRPAATSSSDTAPLVPEKAAGGSGASGPAKLVDTDVISMKLGFVHDVQYRMPEEVKAIILEPTMMCLYGTDKNQVTQLAARLRAIKPPDPYKGAGIRLLGENVKLRQVKK